MVCAYSYSYAQTSLSEIYGKVSDDKHLAAEAATVILLAAADSSIIKSIGCDVNGLFKFSTKPGNYLLLVSKIGYEQSLTGPYELMAGKEVVNNDIVLVPHLPQLKEVSITAQRSYVEVKPGKVVLNVQSSIIAEGNSVIEILRQAPGVHDDGHGNLSIIGRQGALITIDGKQVNLSGQDLTDLLQSMPGSNVQQIELIANPSSRYEAGGAGVINIVSKKGTNAGTNFTANAGIGYGKFYKTNAGLNFNTRMDNVNIFGNYSYLQNKTFHNITTDRIINYSGLLSDYDVNYSATQLGKSHNFRLGTDIVISHNSTLGFLVSGTVNNNDYIKNNVLNISNQGKLDSTISTMSKPNRGQSNISYDVNYTGKLDAAGKTLSADLVFNKIDRHSAEYIDNHFYNAAGVSYRLPLYLQNLSPSVIHIWAAKIDYVNPLSKTSQIEAGVKYSWVESNNDLVFGPKVNGIYTSSPKFSNTFIFKENINSGYINYTNNIGKLNMTAGLRIEETNSTSTSATTMKYTKKSYLDWFPQLQLIYQADEKNEFNFSFNRGITRPQYEDINPFLYYVDLYDYRSGNPNLLPQYANRIQLSHTYNKTFITTLYAAVITDLYDLTDYSQNDSSKVNITTKKNFGSFSGVGLKFFAPVTFNAWWNGNFLADASYQRFKAYPENGNLNKGTSDIILSSEQDFKICSTMSAQLTGKYETPNFYGIGQIKANYRVDAGISKQLFNKNGTLRLTINDIFNTYRDRAVVNYQNLNMTIYDKIETRVIRLGFTYRFGNTSLKGTTRHSAGNEDEQKRATGGVAGNTSGN
ncbi:outer membrane beta-barrel protein [Mucilaginibacter sp.]|uniref:outer membrane beta-barrel protein n=1 Tax=Mucilaginibacter sp. TaxID=1882438 RepID=UPI0026228109|nr:outer membrane beta-barrel protein [Mucilaginibacter sp.]MDB4927455.1 hypothetical protein [Mucilaginibacter sp.]